MYTTTNVALVIFAGLILDGRCCPVGQTPCRDGSKCIYWSWICDDAKDCSDGSDETHCRYACNKYGTRSTTSTGCDCKPAVTGSLCTECSSGYYNFPTDMSKTQCLKCWCSEKTNACTSGGRHRFWINSVKRGEIKQANDDISIVALDRSFLGNQLNSYGGSFEFKFSYERNRTKPIAGLPLLRIWGANKQHISYYQLGNYTPARVNTITIPLVESPAWHLDNMEAVATRVDIMKILVNVSAIHLRTSLFTRHFDLEIISIRLASSRMVSASNTGIQSEIAYEVESCKCPRQFSGESCEDCSKGYIRNGTDCIEIAAQIEVSDPVPTGANFGSGFLAGAFGSASLVVVIALVAFAIHERRMRRLSQMAIRLQNVSGSSLATDPIIFVNHNED